MNDPLLLKAQFARDAWDAARKAERQAATDLRDAIRQARAADYSLAQIAAVLGISRQRVEQLSK